jgi:hypothetical protein
MCARSCALEFENVRRRPGCWTPAVRESEVEAAYLRLLATNDSLRVNGPVNHFFLSVDVFISFVCAVGGIGDERQSRLGAHLQRNYKFSR